MINKQEIENVIERESINGGFEFRDISVEEFRRQENQPHFEMKTSLKNKKTEIRYDSSYEEKNPGKAIVVVGDGAKHEINHHRYKGYSGCPRNLKNHVELIYEPIMDVLSQDRFSNEDAHYVSNALEDTILHDDLSRGFLLEGIKDFLVDVGECSEFSAFYEAHARLNMALWGDKKQKKELRQYYTQDEKQRKLILESMLGFLEESGINQFKKDLSGKQIRDKQEIRNYLLNKENWPVIASAYAKHMSKLMQPNYARALMNHFGKGTKGRELEDTSNEGNEFDREMKTRDFKRTRIQKAYGSGEKAPSWISKFESLDLLYESLAKRLNVKAETFTKQSSMPIFWYGSREFDSETDDFRHIFLGVKDSGEFEIRKKRWHQDMPLEVKISQRGFPRARFGLFDCSSSMASSPNGREIGSTVIIPWGDNSKYHYGLLSWYGFLEYLKQNHLLNQSAVDLATFSEDTRVGKGLLEAKKVALNPNFGNDTLIDLEKVNDFFEGRGNLVFSISDGAVSNWGDIKEQYIKQAGKHYYFHLQIGGKTPMYEDLKKAGLYADTVLGNQDLVSKTIDLTDKILRGGNRK